MSTSKLGDMSHLYDSDGKPLDDEEMLMAKKKCNKKKQSIKKKEK